MISILRLGSAIRRHSFNPDRRRAVMGNIIIRGGLAKGGREKSSPKKGDRTSEFQQALLKKSGGYINDKSSISLIAAKIFPSAFVKNGWPDMDAKRFHVSST
jgi:hypothetical protein